MVVHRSVHELYQDDLAAPIPGLGPAGPEMALSMALHGTLPGFSPLVEPAKLGYGQDPDMIEDQIEMLNEAREQNSDRMRMALLHRMEGSQSARSSSARSASRPTRSPRGRSSQMGSSMGTGQVPAMVTGLLAVWPFPGGPIPREAPPRDPPARVASCEPHLSSSVSRQTTATPNTMERLSASSPGTWNSSLSPLGSDGPNKDHLQSTTEESQMSKTGSKCGPMKQRENRDRANKWIAECKPKAWLLACEKALWIQHRAQRESENKSRNQMLKRMNDRGDMSFESWLMDKFPDEIPEAAAEKKMSLHVRRSMLTGPKPQRLSTGGGSFNPDQVRGGRETRPRASQAPVKRASQRKSMNYIAASSDENDETEKQQGILKAKSPRKTKK